MTAMNTTNLPAQTAQNADVAVGFADSKGFELAQRIANVFSRSTLVPKAYQGNLPNCLIALNMANRMGADPMMTMQNLYVVHGTPAWSAQFLIATFNKSGRFSSIRYEFSGNPGSDDYGCTAKATELATGEVLSGTHITIGLAKKEGWYGKQGSKWQTMPQQMLMYRAASWFIRTHAPEIAMGLNTTDEIRDTYDAAPSSDGVYTVESAKGETSTDLNDIIDAQTTPPASAEPEKQPEQETEKTESAPEPGQPKKTRMTAEELNTARQEVRAELTAAGVDVVDAENGINKFIKDWGKADIEKVRKRFLSVKGV